MQIEDFKDLTHAERKLIKTCSNGSDTIISRNDPKGQPRQHHPRRADPGAVAGHGRAHPPARGLVIAERGSLEQLDLDGEVVPVRLVLVSCTFEEDVILLDCTLPALSSERLPTARTQCPAPALRGVTTSAAWISSDRSRSI